MYVKDEGQKTQQQKEEVMRGLDWKKMQMMQDQFCETQKVYCVCVSRNMQRLTAFSGTKEEQIFIDRVFPVATQRNLIASFSDVDGEDVIAVEATVPYVQLRGIAIRGEENRFYGAWVLVAIDETMLGAEDEVPVGIRRTTAKAFDAAVALLDVLTRNYFSNKIHLVAQAEEIAQLEANEKHMEYLLQKTEVLTEILKMMESDVTFAQIMEDILERVGTYLSLSNAALLKVQPDEENVEMICEWADEKSHAYMRDFGIVPKVDIPFMTGRPYTISSETIMPKPFMDFFTKYGIRCGVFLPLNVNGKCGMYLCFTMMDTERKWSVEDLRFLNDVKCITQTILVKRITKNSLASSYAALEAILENAGCGICVNDLDTGKILYANDAFKDMALTSEDREQLRKVFMISPDGMDGLHEYHALESDRWLEVSFSKIGWVDGSEVRLATIYDISTTKRYQERVEHQANEDYLTGLYNRMRFEEDLNKEIHATVRSGGESAILYIDLDDFNHINDGLGHHVGDLLLQNVADALVHMDGVNGHCYRLGGDEFAIIVTNRHMQQKDAMIRHICNLFSRPWLLQGTEYYCTMSMGVVYIPKDGIDLSLLLQRADIALHWAKSQGKNRVEYYNNNQYTSSVERLDMEKCMREAVDHGCEEFEVYYQPLIDISKPERPCCGAEALVRWNSPTLGFVMPSEFIALAEYLGLINQIGSHVLFEACKRCKYWNDFGHPEYKVNVNLSVIQLSQKDIIDTIRKALEETGIEPANLTLEVTEGLAINDMERMQQVLRGIKSLGVRVALDDFGTGYSSLNHIRSMPIDVIKIDRCFVEDVGENLFSDAFVKSVSQLADALHMHVCVEGVEEKRQCDALKGMNVDMLQGYLFDKPLCAEEFEQKYLY